MLGEPQATWWTDRQSETHASSPLWTPPADTETRSERVCVCVCVCVRGYISKCLCMCGCVLAEACIFLHAYEHLCVSNLNIYFTHSSQFSSPPAGCSQVWLVSHFFPLLSRLTTFSYLITGSLFFDLFSLQPLIWVWQKAMWSLQSSSDVPRTVPMHLYHSFSLTGGMPMTTKYVAWLLSELTG